MTTETMWFHQITNPLNIDECDLAALPRYAMSQLYPDKYWSAKLPEAIINDKEPRIIFISATDGHTMAIVVFGKGYGFTDAIADAVKLLQNSKSNKKEYVCLKLDITHSANLLENVKLLDKVFLNGCLEGIACSEQMNLAFIPEQLVFYNIVDNLNLLRWKKLEQYVKDHINVDYELPDGDKLIQKLYIFSTKSFLYCNNLTFSMYGGHRVIASIEKHFLFEAVRLAGNYLVNAVNEQGRFCYSYNPQRDKETTSYNILRHAGTVYAMFDLYKDTKDQILFDKSYCALQYLLQQINEQKINGELISCLVENDFVKLEGNALAILALANYTEITNNKQYIPVMQQLANWIKLSQDDSGKFNVHKQIFSTGMNTSFSSEYYPGEAIFALSRLYKIDTNVQWLKVTEKAADFLINSRDKGVTLEQQIHDHWLLYGLSELYAINPKERYLNHALKISKAIFLKQHKQPKYPDWQGGFYDPPCSTPTAIRAEGLCAIYPMIKAQGQLEDAQMIFKCIEEAIRFQLQTQFLPESVMYFKNPKRALGGFHNSLTNFEIRIDYVQHNISAILGFYHISNSGLFSIDKTIVKGEDESCKIAFVGDTSFGENYHEGTGENNIINQKGYDYFLKGMDNFLQQADVVVANLQTPLTDQQTSEWAAKKCYVHCSDIEMASRILKKHHIDVVTLANNNIFDYGKLGFEQTLASLKQLNIAFFGAGYSANEAAKPFIIEIQQGKNIKHIAILACFEILEIYDKTYNVYAGDNKPGLNKLDIISLAKKIIQIKAQFPYAFIILCPHWGPNYTLRTEDQKILAEQLVTIGVDLIIGHGSHMLQEIEEVKGTLVCYSIGNFMFNAQGRYNKLNVPPYSAVANLVLSNKSIELNLYPTITNYQSRILDENEFSDFCKLPYMNSFPKRQDQYGKYLTFSLDIAKAMPKLQLIRVNDGFLKRYNTSLWFHDDISVFLKGKWISGKHARWLASGVCYFIQHIVAGDLLFIRRMHDWSGSFYSKEERNIPNLSDYLEPNFEKIFAKGASAVIVDKIPPNLEALQTQNFPIFLVDNTLHALLELAKISRDRFRGKVICITGTVGKSSTKEALFYLLSQYHKVYASNTNFNPKRGIALSLTQTPIDFDFAIYEFAIDLKHNTLPKAMLAKPNIAIITEIQADHLDIYSTLEGVAMQKSLLFEGLQPGGIAILNRDNVYFDLLYEKAKSAKNVSKIITFGCHAEADIYCKHYLLEQDGSEIMVEVDGKTYQYHMKLPGRHMVMNSLGVFAILFALKLDLEKYIPYFNSIPVVHKKNERIKVHLSTGIFEVIDDTTNANPASMATAFELARLLKSKSEGRVIVVIFALHDLGKSSAALHKALAKPLLDNHIDKVYCMGEDMSYLYEQIPEEYRGLYTNDINLLIDKLSHDVKPNDLVLVKGSTYITEPTIVVKALIKLGKPAKDMR